MKAIEQYFPVVLFMVLLSLRMISYSVQPFKVQGVYCIRSCFYLLPVFTYVVLLEMP